MGYLILKSCPVYIKRGGGGEWWLSGERAPFQTAAGHSLTQPGLAGCGGGGKWCVVYHWLYYRYNYCFLSLYVVQVEPQGSTFTFFLLP